MPKYIVLNENPWKLAVHFPGREPYYIWDPYEISRFLMEAAKVMVELQKDADKAASARWVNPYTAKSDA